jgi:hypothetical protein
MFCDRRIVDLLLDRSRDIDDLIEQSTVQKIIREHLASNGGRQRVISVLLGLAIWRRSASVARRHQE